jgi:hypothetical protein
MSMLPVRGSEDHPATLSGDDGHLYSPARRSPLTRLPVRAGIIPEPIDSTFSESRATAC